MRLGCAALRYARRITDDAVWQRPPFRAAPIRTDEAMGVSPWHHRHPPEPDRFMKRRGYTQRYANRITGHVT